MPAYYNEIDPAAAHILRALIAENVIAPGEVDTRSIKEVQPDDLIGFTQCHFFAGGGLWSVAARLAGWPDDEPLWTGSCPCQPFSAAGKGGGTDDPRHLWPDFYRLIRARRPSLVMGEQVAGKAGYGWFDGVRTDLEREDFASRTVDFPACSVDAPHQRNRLYWAAVNVADSYGAGPAADRRDTGEVCGISKAERRAEHNASISRGGDGAFIERLSDTGAEDQIILAHGQNGRHIPSGEGAPNGFTNTDGEIQLADRFGLGRQVSPSGRQPAIARAISSVDQNGNRLHANAGCDGHFQSLDPLRARRDAFDDRPKRNGTYWSDADWIACHDRKARRAKSGLRFLVDGLPGRVDLWRVGGNAIVPEAATEVIAAFIDVYGLPTEWRAAA